MKSIIIGSDHGGFALKEKLKEYLGVKGFKVKDIGTFCRDSCHYPQFAASVAREVSSGNFKKGILICKSGIGNSIVANKFPGVRAALCYNVTAARLSREHNDSNVLVLGSTFVTRKAAINILSAWLKAQFQGGRHKKRLNLIKKIEQEIGAGKK